MVWHGGTKCCTDTTTPALAGVCAWSYSWSPPQNCEAGLLMSAVGTPPATPTPLPSFGDRYRVEREIGRGGMAAVYLCLDTKINRRVAIKLLHPDLAAAVGGDRFHR